MFFLIRAGQYDRFLAYPLRKTDKKEKIMTEFLKNRAHSAPDLAYIKTEGTNALPTVMFLGGFRSDMMGTKATHLEAQCKARGQSFIRFDYRGHGQSGGVFEEACLSDWAQDALDIFNSCTTGAVILVGSSMGGWISLLLAQKADLLRIHALVGLAAAPDFTKWIEAEINDSQKAELAEKGCFKLPNDYDDTPYIITQKLIEDGCNNSFLDKKISISNPVHLIQGKQDADVPWQIAERIKAAIAGSAEAKITYIKDADHMLSSPEQLMIIDKAIEEFNAYI